MVGEVQKTCSTVGGVTVQVVFFLEYLLPDIHDSRGGQSINSYTVHSAFDADNWHVNFSCRLKFTHRAMLTIGWLAHLGRWCALRVVQGLRDCLRDLWISRSQFFGCSHPLAVSFNRYWVNQMKQRGTVGSVQPFTWATPWTGCVILETLYIGM